MFFSLAHDKFVQFCGQHWKERRKKVEVATRSHASKVRSLIHVNMQIVKPHLHGLIGTQVPRILYGLQKRS